MSSQDYDAWGYLMDGRSYTPENSMYKFTGKERDKDIENNYSGSKLELLTEKFGFFNLTNLTNLTNLMNLTNFFTSSVSAGFL